MQENPPISDERADYETPRLERHEEWTIVTGNGGGVSGGAPNP